MIHKGPGSLYYEMKVIRFIKEYEYPYMFSFCSVFSISGDHDNVIYFCRPEFVMKGVLSSHEDVGHVT